MQLIICDNDSHIPLLNLITLHIFPCSASKSTQNFQFNTVNLEAIGLIAGIRHRYYRTTTTSGPFFFSINEAVCYVRAAIVLYESPSRCTLYLHVNEYVTNATSCVWKKIIMMMTKGERHLACVFCISHR